MKNLTLFILFVALSLFGVTYTVQYFFSPTVKFQGNVNILLDRSNDNKVREKVLLQMEKSALRRPEVQEEMDKFVYDHLINADDLSARSVYEDALAKQLVRYPEACYFWLRNGPFENPLFNQHTEYCRKLADIAGVKSSKGS